MKLYIKDKGRFKTLPYKAYNKQALFDMADLHHEQGNTKLIYTRGRWVDVDNVRAKMQILSIMFWYFIGFMGLFMLIDTLFSMHELMIGFKLCAWCSIPVFMVNVVREKFLCDLFNHS